MKRLLTFLWVGLFIGLLGDLQEASATHLMGSDIIYPCLGNGTLKSGNDEVKTLEEVVVGAKIYTVNLLVTSRIEEGECVQNAEPVQIEVLPTPIADFAVNRWKTAVT